MLIGRDVELAEVGAAVADGRSVVVVGCLGVGRTAFAAAIAAAHGVPVLSASASMSTIPFAAVAEHAVGDDTTARLASVTGWLTSMPIVVIDDAHLLDPETAIACRLAARQVPVVATVLEHATVDDAISGLWRSGGERCHLAPLADAHTRALLESMAGGGLDPWTELHASRVSGGLPAVIEAVADAVRRAAGDRSSVPSDAVADLAPPSSLVDRCRAALGTEVLAALALLGVVHDTADHEFERQCGRGALAACGSLVEVDGSGRVRPRSSLLASAAVGAVPAARLGELLADLDVSRLGALGRVAVADARREPLRADDLFTAAVAAARAHHGSSALRLLERAEGDTAADPAERLLAIARVGSLLDRPDMVELAASQAASMPMPAGRRGGLVALVAAAAARRPGATNESVMAAIDALDTDPAAAAEVEAQRVAVLYELGRFDEAVARRRAQGDVTDRAQRMQTYIAEAGYRMAIGDTVWVREQAITHLATGMSLGPEAVRPVVSALLVALIFEFQYDEAERMLDLGEATLGRSNPEQRVMMLAARAALEMNRCRTREAERLVVEAVGLARSARLYDLLSLLGSLGVHASVTGGHTEQLASYLELARLPSSTLSGVSALLNPGVEGSAAIARGDRKAAVSHVLVAAQRARTLGLPGAEVLQLANAVRFGATTSLRSQRVAKLRDGFSSPVLRVLADRIVATERADPHGLLDVAEFYGSRGNALEATESALQAAAAARQAGQEELAVRCDLRALEWERLLDGISSPLMTLLRGGGGRFQLTRREREVVDLAQQGLSNREIAERTYTSVRTVEGHLMRAYAKLGVDGRDGLRARAR